jgi:hypothetical protein
MEPCVVATRVSPEEVSLFPGEVFSAFPGGVVGRPFDPSRATVLPPPQAASANAATPTATAILRARFG